VRGILGILVVGFGLICSGAHVVAHHALGDFGHLDNRVTIDDPGAYSRPFTTTYTATLQPDDEIMEYICNENNNCGVAGGFR